MLKELNLNNILRGRVQDENRNWIDLTEDQQYEYFQIIKEFLLSTCRNGSGVYNKVKYTTLSQAKENNCYWFNRLIIEERNGELVGAYIAGQEYTSEIRDIKKKFYK